MTNIETLLKETKEKMHITIEHFNEEMKKIRVGKAEALSLYNVRIKCYGTISSLHEIAQISTPEFNQFLIRPHDINLIKDVIEGLNLFNSDFSPVTDNKVIRITLPPINEELRKKSIKALHELVEKCRIEIRNGRHAAREIIGKDKDLSKDNVFFYNDELQKITDAIGHELSELAKKREESILKI